MTRTLVIIVDEDVEHEFPLTQSLKGAGMISAGFNEHGHAVLVAAVRNTEVAQTLIGFCWCHPAVKLVHLQPLNCGEKNAGD